MGADWSPPSVRPKRPGVYRVQVAVPAFTAAPDYVTEMFARWTGDYWTCWGPDAGRLMQVEFRGPSAGYTWAEV